MVATRRWLGLALCAAAATGCLSRLHVTKTYALKVGQVQALSIDAPARDQTVTVAVETDAPVTVYMFLQRDEEQVEHAVQIGKMPEKALAKWEGDSAGSLSAKVPAKEVAIVRAESGSKAAKVKLKITG